MTGGLAVRANLLCVTWSSARGHVFLFDLEARRPLSAWVLPAGPGGYSVAAGVAMDEHFHLFVADPHAHCVRHFSAFGRHLGDLGRPAAATGGWRDRPGELLAPHAVALVDDVLLVGGGDRPLRRGVQRLRKDGRVLAPLLPPEGTEGWFHAPRGLGSDAVGILVADTQAGRVLRYRRNGTFVAAVRIAAPLEETVARPVAVVRMRGGDLLVVDAGDRPGVRRFAVDGAPRPDAGELAARAEQPLALARDDEDRIYLLDRGGERVQRFRPDLAFDASIVDLAEHLDDFGRSP